LPGAVLPAQTSWAIENVNAIASVIAGLFGWSSGTVASGIEWSLTNQYMPKWAYTLAVACLGKLGCQVHG
jgi:hypothetical protein